jgi:carboxymethylenebutenolidase
MLKRITLCCIAILCLSNDQAKGGEQKIKTETITLTQGGVKFSCYVARPDVKAAAPGLILIHEWWGLNDWVRQQADRFAKMGYVAIAPDLYHGEVAKDAEHAHELMRGLTDERAVGDLQEAFKYLTENEATKGKPVGVIGWCMGGGFALRLAIAEPRIAASVVCYGRPVTDVEQLKKIKGPLLGIWGEKDRGIEVEPFKKALEQAKVKAEHHVYPDAGHAFLNETNERGYNKEQAEKAWKEIDRFLKAHLGP